MNLLEEKLRSVKSAGTPPLNLHDSIVSAVRAASEKHPARVSSDLPAWWWVAGAPALILIGVWVVRLMTVSPPDPLLSLASAAPDLATVHQFARDVPAAMVSPMSDELAAVDRDVRKAVAHLVASVPGAM